VGKQSARNRLLLYFLFVLTQSLNLLLQHFLANFENRTTLASLYCFFSSSGEDKKNKNRHTRLLPTKKNNNRDKLNIYNPTAALIIYGSLQREKRSPYLLPIIKP